MKKAKALAKRIVIVLVFICMYYFIKDKVDLNTSDGKKKEVDFYICKETEIPDRLAEIIMNKRRKSFELTYENGKYLYIAIGYGEKSMDNQSVVLKEIYETEKVIGVETNLYTDAYIKEHSEYSNRVSKFEKSFCPCIVIRCEKKEKPVYFKVSYIN